VRSPWVASCRYLLPLQCAQNELQEIKDAAHVRNAPDNHSEQLSDNPRDAFPVGQEGDSRYSLGHCSSLPISSGRLPSLISTSHELFF
jgi:hypothetical protein